MVEQRVLLHVREEFGVVFVPLVSPGQMRGLLNVEDEFGFGRRNNPQHDQDRQNNSHDYLLDSREAADDIVLGRQRRPHVLDGLIDRRPTKPFRSTHWRIKEVSWIL
jgi:hypothetical protein